MRPCGMGVTLRPKGFRMLRILCLILAAAIATPAFAQSKISIEGGPLVPLGEFNDWADVSWWAGLRGGPTCQMLFALPRPLPKA